LKPTAEPELTPSQRRTVDRLSEPKRKAFAAVRDRGVLAGVALQLVLDGDQASVWRGVAIFDGYVERGEPCGPGLLVAAIRGQWQLPKRLRERFQESRLADLQGRSTADWQRGHRADQASVVGERVEAELAIAAMPAAERGQRASEVLASWPATVREQVLAWCRESGKPPWRHPLLLLAVAGEGVT